jgi:glycosyltransferase involved in cell wall biosynthesis
VLDDGELGLLFEPGDVETLAAQLERLIGDRDLRERLRERGAAARASARGAAWPTSYEASTPSSPRAATGRAATARCERGWQRVS